MLLANSTISAKSQRFQEVVVFQSHRIPRSLHNKTRSTMFSLALAITSKLRSSDKDSPSAIKKSDLASNNAPSLSSSDQALLDYILKSPILSTCGLTPSEIASSLPQWKLLGSHIAKNLNFPPTFDQLNDIQKLRTYQYYLPVYFWCQKQLEAHQSTHKSTSKQAPPPLIIGISAPQGCGKSTLCEQLESLFAFTNKTAASISIDDFYLTYQGQQNVASTHNGNPLLQFRGNAGSHDLSLGTETLKTLVSATTTSSSVALPRYDKSAYQGKGDRADKSTWPVVLGPVDIVLFEGWMLGFNSVGKDSAAKVDPNLIPIDSFLKEYKSAWDSFINAWLVIKVADPQYAYTWRLQAEQRMRASGKSAMTDEEVGQFVDRFMPAYRCYLSGLYSDGPTTGVDGKVLVVEVDQNRSPIR